MLDPVSLVNDENESIRNCEYPAGDNHQTTVGNLLGSGRCGPGLKAVRLLVCVCVDLMI